MKKLFSDNYSRLLLEVENLHVSYKTWKTEKGVLKDISFSMHCGEVIGLGGESGCGKTTLARVLFGLINDWTGNIFLRGQHLKDLLKCSSIEWRRHQQLIFQNPSISLNPKMRVRDILLEPLVIHKIGTKASRLESIVDLLHQVGLSEAHLTCLPHELSGGQKQRIAIARALALKPQLLVCDEPFSSLDNSIRAQVVSLLKEIQQKHKMAILLISHDLALLRHFSDRILIMYQGSIVEEGPSREVYDNPLHPYTKTLVSSVLPKFRSRFK